MISQVRRVSNLPHMGDVIVTPGGTVKKYYVQFVSGTAYRKIGSDILQIAHSGYIKLEIYINKNHYYFGKMQDIVKMAQAELPQLDIKFLVMTDEEADSRRTGKTKKAA